jgi:hypothetical protein
MLATASQRATLDSFCPFSDTKLSIDDGKCNDQFISKKTEREREREGKHHQQQPAATADPTEPPARRSQHSTAATTTTREREEY